jgi:hypothetical protein
MQIAQCRKVTTVTYYTHVSLPHSNESIVSLRHKNHLSGTHTLEAVDCIESISSERPMECMETLQSIEWIGSIESDTEYRVFKEPHSTNILFLLIDLRAELSQQQQ